MQLRKVPERIFSSVGLYFAKIFYFVNSYRPTDWNSYESSKKLLERQDYSLFQNSMKSITDGPFSFLHFEFDEVVDSVLDAPITEVVTISPKQGRTLEEVTTVMKKNAPFDAPVSRSHVWDFNRTIH